MASFERYLIKKKNYGFSIRKDADFEPTHKALQSKQEGSRERQGNIPNILLALTEEEIKILNDKELLGTNSLIHEKSETVRKYIFLMILLFYVPILEHVMN